MTQPLFTMCKPVNWEGSSLLDLLGVLRFYVSFRLVSTATCMGLEVKQVQPLTPEQVASHLAARHKQSFCTALVTISLNVVRTGLPGPASVIILCSVGHSPLLLLFAV